MPGGRPRKPVEAKILAGTFRKDRDGGRSVAASGLPKPPAYLEGEALAYWKEIVPGMVERGMVCASDSSQLALLCWLHSEVLHLIGVIKEDRAKKLPDSKLSAGVYVQLGICLDKYDRVAAKFGQSPSDRAKLRVDAAPKGRVEARKRG